MSELTERIQLTSHDRDLILQCGYVSGRLEAALRRWPKGQLIRQVGMTRVDRTLTVYGRLSHLQWLDGALTVGNVACCIAIDGHSRV